METICMLINIIILLIFAAAGFGLMIFPIVFDTDIKKKTGTGFLNRWMTGIELICFIGCFDPSSDSFYGNLACFVLSIAASAFVAWKKAKKLRLGRKRAFAAVFAQVFSPVSLLIIVLMIERLVSEWKKSKKG